MDAKYASIFFVNTIIEKCNANKFFLKIQTIIIFNCKGDYLWQLN